MIQIENFLFKGSGNCCSREYLVQRTGLNDRAVRLAIEDAIESRHIPIVNVGNGYFIPDGSIQDELALNEYFLREKSRTITLMKKLNILKNAVGYDRNQITLEDVFE